MTKNFGYYYKKASHASWKTLYRKRGNFYRYYMWVGLSILSLILWPLIPLAKTMKYKIADQTLSNENIYLADATSGVDTPKSYGTLWGCWLAKFGLELGCVIVIGILGAILFFMGLPITLDSMVGPIIMASPAAILLVILFFALPFIQVPVAYLFSKDNTLSVADALSQSYDALKHGGKKQLFISYLLQGLVFVGFLAIPGILYYLAVLMNLEYYEYELAMRLYCYASILLLVVLAFLPYFMMKHRIIRNMIYDDVVFDRYKQNTTVKGIKYSPVRITPNTTLEHKLEEVFSHEEIIDDELEDISLVSTPKSKEEQVVEDTPVLEQESQEYDAYQDIEARAIEPLEAIEEEPKLDSVLDEELEDERRKEEAFKASEEERLELMSRLEETVSIPEDAEISLEVEKPKKKATRKKNRE